VCRAGRGAAYAWAVGVDDADFEGGSEAVFGGVVVAGGEEGAGEEEGFGGWDMLESGVKWKKMEGN